MNPVAGVDHVTLRCAPAQLSAVSAFYESVVGLRPGARPPFDFPGAWLYAGELPVLHLAAVLATPIPAQNAQASVRPAASQSSGYVDHFALRMNAGLGESLAKLESLGVPFAQAPVPGLPLHQVFLVDPLGVKVELNFVVER